MNSYCQDTTYYQKRGEMYMMVRTHITNVNVKPRLNIKQRRANTRFITFVSTMFIGLTVWYFHPY